MAAVNTPLVVRRPPSRWRACPAPPPQPTSAPTPMFGSILDPCGRAPRARVASLPAVHLVEGVVAEDGLVVLVAVIFGEGALLAQEGKGRRHRRVLVLDRELAGVRIGRDGRGDDLAALRRLGGGDGHGDRAADGRAHRLHPHGHIDVARRLVVLDVGHVADHRELLRAGGEDHLADVARTALAVLRLRVGLGVHRVHRELQQLGVAVGALDGGAEEVEAAHVGRPLNLDALLAALLDDRLAQLLRLLQRLFLRLSRTLGLLLTHRWRRSTVTAAARAAVRAAAAARHRGDLAERLPNVGRLSQQRLALPLIARHRGLGGLWRPLVPPRVVIERAVRPLLLHRIEALCHRRVTCRGHERRVERGHRRVEFGTHPRCDRVVDGPQVGDRHARVRQRP
mmetsp:Transcript_87705/g.263726  ORF Transcript_87705/g.263726 Transcript_87705/m.263726 type:complete len:396 (-) Transcript_87705:870-2057(-)